MRVNSSYIIITGLFRFDSNKVDQSALSDKYADWSTRINNGDYQSTFDYIDSAYYDNYINNMFPGVRGVIKGANNLSHLTLKSTESLKGHKLVLSKTNSLDFDIEFADLYLFPDNIGIFSIKTQVASDDLNAVSDFLNQIRYLSSSVQPPNSEQSITIKKLIENILLAPLNLDDNWDIYNPQLKTYTLIDLKDQISSSDLDRLLFDFGNVSKPGTAKSEDVLAPSEKFFNKQIDENTISVFKNWGAIALFDTFTRISMDFPDKFKSWEHDYFQIYIHALYVKFYMYLTNSELSDVTVVTKKTQQLRDKFIEFINDYDLSHISYKFLPNLIHDKLIFALDIQSEIDKMESKIQRLNDHFQEKRQRNLNVVLIVITVLSVFSLISELSEWFIRLGVSQDFMYPLTSIGIGISILILLLVVYKINNK